MALPVLFAAGCTRKPPITVGSKASTGQTIVGEIVAQQLEKALGRKVQRNLGIGNTALAYQSLVSSEISLYPEETATIQTEVLKEAASVDPAQSLERCRNEVRRLAQSELLDPLGLDDGWRFFVRKDEKESMLSEAKDASPGWKLGITREFDQRQDGLPTLKQYLLPMAALPRVTDAASIYRALDAGEINMAVGLATDGTPTRHDWKTLADDRKYFPLYQTCLLVRADVLASDPKIKPALAALSGKFTNEALAKLAAQVELDHKSVADVAADFLAQAGLK